jgi:hypothetical protein
MRMGMRCPHPSDHRSTARINPEPERTRGGGGDQTHGPGALVAGARLGQEQQGALARHRRGRRLGRGAAGAQARGEGRDGRAGSAERWPWPVVSMMDMTREGRI